MLRPGDVVTADFAGARAAKRRPLVVIATDTYHTTRPDTILAELTSQVHSATAPTDYVLQDWAAAGLRLPTAFRLYLGMALASAVTPIGRLSDRDWSEVQARLRVGIAVS
jgi:mRNA interferase MazF